MALLLIVGLSGCGLSPALPADLPSPDIREVPDLLTRAIDAAGGRDAMARVHSRMVVARAQVVETGQEGLLQFAIRSPDEFVAEFDLGSFGRTLEGSTGEHAWQWVGGKARLLSGSEAEQAKSSGTLHRLLDLESRKSALRLAPIEEFDRHRCYALVETGAEGTIETFLIDTASFLVIGSRVVYRQGLDTRTIETAYENPRPVDGLLLAHRIRQRSIARNSPTLTYQFDISNVTHNLSGPEFEEVFALPPEVTALLPAD
ncbi:MAG: hypothetical protein KDC38_15745 [Planctomycetes bacterium]|nr:hypothetical protein [Planctomycetota bacterium]